jgi:tetratricopeptide (TPR) repeat protein
MRPQQRGSRRVGSQPQALKHYQLLVNYAKCEGLIEAAKNLLVQILGLPDSRLVFIQCIEIITSSLRQRAEIVFLLQGLNRLTDLNTFEAVFSTAYGLLKTRALSLQANVDLLLENYWIPLTIVPNNFSIPYSPGGSRDEFFMIINTYILVGRVLERLERFSEALNLYLGVHKTYGSQLLKYKDIRLELVIAGHYANGEVVNFPEAAFRLSYLLTLSLRPGQESKVLETYGRLFQDVGMYAEAESCFKLLLCTRNKIIALECLEKIKESTAFFHHLKPIVQEPPLKIVDARYPGVPVYITDMAYKPQAQTSTLNLPIQPGPGATVVLVSATSLTTYIPRYALTFYQVVPDPIAPVLVFAEQLPESRNSHPGWPPALFPPPSF